ncbi:uncharacterized protein LOC144271419 [Eretmochelys imbricata]
MAEHSPVDDVCMPPPREVEEHSGLNFPRGSRYSYRYSTATNTFLQGSIYKRSGMSLESTVIIEALGKCHMVLKLQDVQIKTTLTSREESLKEMDSLREVLEQNPLQFSFHDGKILKICPQQCEQAWVLNIKRGILSVLQTSPAAAGSGTVEEMDILGKCPTKYQRKGPLVLKTKDLNLCSHRYSGFISLQSIALPDMLSQQQILSSKLECAQSFKDGILAEAKCTESSLVTPFSRKGSGAKTQTQSSLKLLQVEAEMLYKTVDSSDLYVSNMLYEREENEKPSTGEEVAELMRKLCLAHSMSFETADLFMSLVFELRSLSADTLIGLWRRSSFKCRDNWQPLVDALPSCATEACVVLMKEIIVAREVEEDKMESFLWSLSFIPEPTTGMINSLAPLLQSPGASRSVFLGITALVHHFCSANGACDLLPAIQMVTSILEGYLGGNCTLQESGLSQLQLVLKAIGNAGLAATSLTPVLSSCASLRSNPTEIRLAAIQAFRRIPCAANRTVLVRLYQAGDDDVEIRIASYYIAMKCPSEELFNQVQQTLQEETSSQVGSFVWSHLSQLLETDDPLKQHLRDSLPDDILSREFDWEIWKYSSYSDVTFHSATAGANVETALVFSPASFIPRSTMTNLTIHTLGRAINLLEFNVWLENAEDLMQKMVGQHSATFSEYLFTNTDERNSKSENPVEAAGKPKQKKLTSKRDSRGDRLVTKGAKPKLRKAKQSCPDGKYNKMSELVKKPLLLNNSVPLCQFTERMGKKKELKCELSIKIFGNELSFLDCEDIKKQVKHYSLNLAELAVKLLKGQEVQFNKRLSLATEELLFPSISGFQVRLALNASAATNVKIKGNVDFKQRSNFFINGYLKLSAFIQISAQMGIVGNLGRAGLNWVTGLRTSTSLDGGIQVKKGQELKVFLNTPEESMEIINFSSKFYLTTMDGMENIEGFQDHIETKSCTSEEVSKIFGWQLCSEMSYPGKTSGLPFPFSGPAKAAMTLKKQDRGLQQYLMEAAYNYTPQEDSWIPSEVVLHFFIGTPKSDLKRDVGVDLNFNVPQKKFRIKFMQPKKKIQVDGKLELSKNSRIGHLELVLDDKDVYYIKGMTGLQTVSGEQRYTTQLEVKLIKQGSPIVLSGNITKQLGKKMAFSVSLHNLLKDAAFLSVFLEKKVDDKLRQYSLEGETYLPGVLGSHTIGLLQQRGSLWSNALRIKYGLLGDAKNLRHECNAGQKIKVENNPNEAYKLDLGHELHCTQTPSYNHKVHLRHEESASRLYSQLDVNYGKHWDEINNKRKLLISQTFKNSSSPSQVNYFMEFTMQVPEKQVNYRTQLQHSRTSQGRSESSTNFKVQYNDRMPFVAGLQWKDTSRNYLRKWEGALNMDTPWLYLYVAHKLHQPEQSAHLSSMELTAGKALSIKNLVVEMFCKDKGNEKEGKIHIYTPTTTYLRASTVNHLERNVLHSYSEVVSVWNQLVRNEIHLENSERAKFLCFKIKSTKQEFNLSADYLHLQGPKKTNFSLRALWTDHKSLPVVLQLEGQIEELKKDKMFYQKRGTIHFRHPFKLPIPQSFLLQETFTVDKKQKHYFLETKILINGLDESVQTFTLGYQAEHPYICAGLAHPYNSKIFPKNVEICALTRCHQSAKHEIEAILKVNEKDAVRFLGKYQNKSSEMDFRHLLHMNMTHSFQLKFPQALALNGELFSVQSKWEIFDYGVNIKATINRNDSSQFIAQLNGSNAHFGFSSRFTHPYQSKFPQSFQAHAAVKIYGENSLNGSLYLHSSGKDLVLLEVDMSKETRKNNRIIGVSALLHQAILTEPESVQLQLMGKVSPSRLLLSSELKLNENRLHLDFVGVMEQKVGLVLSLNGKVQHNIGGLKVIPQLFSLNGSLKRKNNIHEGNISVMINKALYGLNLRNRNVFGNISLHNITFTLTQNSSQAIPMEAKLKGHLELNKGIKRGLASFQVDEQALYIDVSNVMSQEHRGITGTLIHNINSLKNAGFPMDGTITAMYDHVIANHTVTIALQSSSERIAAAFGVERLSLESPKSQLTASLKHNITKLKKHGIPFTVEGACYYQVNCNGKSTTNQLSGHCSGEVASRLFEMPARVSLNGSVFTSNSTANFIGHVSSDDAFIHLHLHATGGLQHRVEIGFKHSLPQLQSLGIAKENQLKVSAVRGDKYKGLLDIVLGQCTFKADGEVRPASNETDTEWTVTLMNTCVTLQAGECKLKARGDLQTQNKTEWTLETEMECLLLQVDQVAFKRDSGSDLNIPVQSQLIGSIQRDGCQAELLCTLKTDGKSAHLKVRTECQPNITVEIEFRHELPQLKEIPGENKLSIMAGKELKYSIDIELKSGTCELQANGDLQVENKLQWKMLMENKCKTMQQLGTPIKIDGSGYIMIDRMNLDSQMLIIVDESTLQGLLILKATNDKQELDALITHNIQGAIDLGIPARTLVDVTSEKNGDLYKRFIQFSVDGKQITEELSFIRKLDHVSINYKLTHNIEALKALRIEDRIELQMVVSLQILNSTQERRVQIMTGRTSVTYTVNSRYIGQQMEIFCQSVHNSEALLTFGYPKATNLTLVLQKLANKAKTTFEIQYDDKYITLNMDVVTDFELYDTFELMAEVKHSITVLKHLGLPFMSKIAFLEVLTASEIEGSMKLTCEPNTNLSVTINVKNEQQSEELNIKALHNVPFLLQYFPGTAELSSKLKFLPRQLVFMMVYQKSNRTHLLRHIVLWDGKEVKVTGAYTGLFPKLSGGHDIKVEFFHPLSIPFPWHSKVNMYVEHSTHNHQDDVTIGWNNKDQVFVSSSLKFGKEHVKYRATVAHPFNFSLRQLEVSSLSERKGGKYNQQIQLTWNGGQPADFKITLEDKSKFNITLWDACVAVSSGQLQKVLTVGNLQACGSIKQATILFTEYLDLNWDGKKITQNLTYERNRPLYPDEIQLEATLENVFLTSCSKQHMLGKIETDFSTWLDYYMSLALCDLPNVIVLSGKHQLNRGDIILQSEGRLHHTGDVREDGVLTIALKNNSTAEVKKYLMEFELKASEDIWLGLTGTATSSAVQSQVLMEGNIDQKEKVKVTASKGKGCHQYYMGYVKGDLEEGVELTACTDGQQMATINTYLSINGVRQERMGQLMLTAVNQSLSLVAHGCGDPVVKVEYKLNEIGSHLKAKLLEKIKKFDESVWKFRRSVQQIDFLYEAAGWPLKASQEVAGILQSGGKAVAQMWKQSGIRQTLRNNLPLYLEKIQDTVQQMQNELKKPLATLKDAYYDVTLKRLDDVWQEKTEAYMKKIQAFVPSIVKDVWLMEPIQVTLRAMKTGLDMATHQMLRWAEAKFSRAVSKFRKPLSNLYSFSARNCAMAVKLPMLPKGDHSVDLANITNYLIEEQIMRPLRDLYNINPVAEYYRIKQRMMESPFEYHAVLMGNKHFRTFDGRMYDLTSKCSVLLAKDFIHNTFTVVLNQESSGLRSLHMEMNQTTIDIYPGLKTYKMYNFSQMEENCLSLDQSLEKNGITIRKDANRIEVLNENGVFVSCNFHYDLCTVTLDGWHHGVSAGLFGTNDNEAGNEWMLPNHSYTGSVQEFTQSWQVSSHCNYVQKKVKPCSITAKQKVCKVFFREPHSLLRNCFKVVDPEPFYSMCMHDACDSSELKAACNLAAAFVHLCSRNFVPLEIPSQCGKFNFCSSQTLCLGCQA